MSRSYLTSEQWAHFLETQLNGFETFGKESISFTHKLGDMDGFFEGAESWEDSTNNYTSTFTLNCLISYNYYRVWGVNKNSVSGEKQAQSIVAIFNPVDLASVFQDRPDIYNQSTQAFTFDSNTDYFIHRGIRYTPQGDTPLSQQQTSPLWVMVILQVDGRQSGVDKGNQT